MTAESLTEGKKPVEIVYVQGGKSKVPPQGSCF